MRPVAVIGVLAALVAAASGVGTSSAAFTAHQASTTSMATAADWIAPALTLTAPANGSYSASTTVALAGAAGSATGDSTTVTVNLYTGSAATGTPTTRPVTRTGATWTTTLTGLGQGAYTAQATQADTGGNTATSATSTFTVDTVAPTRASVGAANGTGTAGHLDAGDAITFIYSERMLPSSILSGWTGSSAATVKVRFFSGAAANGFTVLDSASGANVKLDAGTISTGGVSIAAGYVTGTVNFAATLTQSSDGKSFVVTLVGTADQPSRVVSAAVSTKNMAWTPKAGATDMAGNALASTAAYTETDGDRDF